MTLEYRILKGATNVSVTIRIIDSTDGTPETAVEHNTAGMAMEYRREGAVSTAITEVALAALTTAHTDGGIEHIGNGYYRFDVPDAAFATGVTGVLIHGTVTGMVVIGAYVHLVDVDDQDAVRMGMTALPNAAADAAGGLAISDAGGLDLDAMNTNINDIETDTADMQPRVAAIEVDTSTTLQAELDAIQAAVITNAAGADIAADIIAVKAETATILVDTGTTLDTKINDIQGATFSSATDSLEAIRNRGDAAWTTGAGGTPPQLLQSTTIATLASQVSFTLTAGSADDDAYNNAIAVVTDSATSTQKAVGTVSDYTGASKTVTLSADPGIFTMAVGDTIEIIAALGGAGSAPTAAAVADAVWDEAQADHVAAGSFGLIASEIATIDTVVDGIQTDLDNGTDGLGAIKTAVDTVDGNVDAILVDTAEIGVAGAGLTEAGGTGDQLTALSTHSAADVWGVATRVLTAGTNIALAKGTGVTGFNDLSAAQVNAEVVDVLVTDTHAEVGQGAPPATASKLQMLQYLYKAWRNRSTQTATLYQLYNDDAVTVDHKATVSDDATTFDRNEVATGP